MCTMSKTRCCKISDVDGDVDKSLLQGWHLKPHTETCFTQCEEAAADLLTWTIVVFNDGLRGK